MEIYEADTIERYNRYFGFETRHPLVSIVHFDDTVHQPTHCMHFGFYALFIKNTTGCNIKYGKTTYIGSVRSRLRMWRYRTAL